ncbi:hypothetical protein BASA61_006383 [Batrachochytrium salamandrivorans]|nr:hypothetical protein BASA61_006383 [Batrachochytrium salamandrivorans]
MDNQQPVHQTMGESTEGLPSCETVDPLSLNSSEVSVSTPLAPARTLPEGRKRKWDVQKLDQDSASTGADQDPEPANKIVAITPTSAPFSEVESVIASTAAATAAAVSRLSALQPLPKSAAHSVGQFTKDIEINDIKNRYLLTNAATQHKLTEETSVDVTTRGKFYPDRNRATLKDPPLHLHLIASSQESLDLAIHKVNLIIEQASITLVEPRIHHSRTFFHEKIYVDIEATPSMNLRAKIVGPGGSYMKHIQHETSTRVQLKGRGSGFTEASTGQEADEEMFITISGSIEKGVESAKQLCEDLLDTVRKEVEKLQQRMRPPLPPVPAPPPVPIRAPTPPPVVPPPRPPPPQPPAPVPAPAPYNHYVVAMPAPQGYPSAYPYYGGGYGHPPPYGTVPHHYRPPPPPSYAPPNQPPPPPPPGHAPPYQPPPPPPE